AIDLATGKEKWKHKAAPFKAAASVRGESVYVGDGDGLFHCLDPATGKKRWAFETAAVRGSGGNLPRDRPPVGAYGAPLYCLAACYDETLDCLSAEGKKLWDFKIQGPVNGSPAVAGDRTFVAGCDSLLHVLDTDSGKEQTQVDLEGQAGATAAVRGDELFVG